MIGLLQRLLEQSAVLLLLDFDGTLSEIAPTPDGAALYPGNACLLRLLNDAPEHTVGILSGRALDDVRSRVGVESLVYAGNHGLEIDGPGIAYLHPDAQSLVPDIADACRQLTSALSAIPGCFVENKTLTLTAHYRQSPERYHRQVAEVFTKATATLVHSNRCRITAAKAALELRPAIDWNKGFALAHIRQHLCPTAFPLYLGDDATDEDAFVSAQGLGGAGVFVGPPEVSTAAQYRLADPLAVHDFLANLVAGNRNKAPDR